MGCLQPKKPTIPTIPTKPTELTILFVGKDRNLKRIFFPEDLTVEKLLMIIPLENLEKSMEKKLS